ncbi:TetR/AcrR family transcriptional regulator [Peribacillus saganii]|uniref:TetR/AcrR family transcriptional regulator n=1 Tax=Peribacillus saganii TaxID=2303992 RepID=A0A372LLP4_9BACI|nr:TetR/AcrR family transcriptional regulator [Peribacillus saganii]RFU67902.1 TetR/AcrR family transcriptional regulator [Peribacillus saganii]
MSPRKAVDVELSRSRIMEAARRLFVKEGYRNVSMRKIAKELDYTHGAIYYHFENEAELFYALVKEDFSLLDGELNKVMAQELEDSEKLTQILLGFIKFGLENPNHYEIMFLITDEEIKGNSLNEPDNSYARFAQAVYLLCAKQVDTKTIWSLFLSIHGFVAVYCRSGQSYEDVRDLAESHVQLLLRAIGNT